MFKSSSFFKFVVFLQFFYLYQVFASNDMGGFGFSFVDLSSVFFSLFTAWLFFRMIGAWTSFSRVAFVGAAFFGITLYGLLTAYHFGTHQMAEWAFIADNFTSAFNVESVNVVLSSFDIGGLLYIPFIVLFWGVLEWRYHSISKAKLSKPLLPKVVFITFFYFVCMLLPITPRDPVMAFFRSIWNYYTSDITRGVTLKAGQYPFFNTSDRFFTGTVQDGQKPHVFLIVCESLNASAVNRVTPAGKPVMPFLRQLQSESVFVEHFYSNSIQTAKGHFSILFSTIPSIVGKEASLFTDVRLQSLASVLLENGYDTTYFGAHKSKRFDNNFNFFTTHGFRHFVTSKTFLKPEDEPFKSHWGPQDTVFFKRFFDYFETIPSKNIVPQFVMLTTIYSHFPFNFIKEGEGELYPNSPSLKQKYDNAIHLTDKGLQLFFDELNKRPDLKKNALVIIVGDHGFPLGEHGNFSLPAGYHEESFRVPFFMVWDGVIQPKVVKGPFSQMDIAPTVLDVLNIKTAKTQFQGTSILGTPPEVVFLIQPYERQLSLIHFPYKYRFDTKLSRAYLYNLQVDSMEKINRISTLSKFQKEWYNSRIRQIFLNQKAFEQDQFLPKEF